MPYVLVPQSAVSTALVLMRASSFPLQSFPSLSQIPPRPNGSKGAWASVVRTAERSEKISDVAARDMVQSSAPLVVSKWKEAAQPVSAQSLPARIITAADLLRAGSQPIRALGPPPTPSQSLSACTSTLADSKAVELCMVPAALMPRSSSTDSHLSRASTVEELSSGLRDDRVEEPQQLEASEPVPASLSSASPISKRALVLQPPAPESVAKGRTGRERKEKRRKEGTAVVPPPPSRRSSPRPMMTLPPTPCIFEGLACPVVKPSPAALAQLDRAIFAHYRSAREVAAAQDAVTFELMGHVQAAAGGIWPRARVACFGSRATGLVCATSDIDLCLVGVTVARDDAASMDAQLSALELLLPHLSAVPGVTSATINRSAVPVIAVTANAAAFAATAKDGRTTGVSNGVSNQCLQIDISIHTERHRGLVAADHIRWLCSSLPPLAPLVVFLKVLLQKADLKSAFTGGLSSFALVLMVARFLIDRPMLRYTRWGGVRRSQSVDRLLTAADLADLGRVVAGAEAELVGSFEPLTVEPTSAGCMPLTVEPTSAGCIATDAALSADAAAATDAAVATDATGSGMAGSAVASSAVAGRAHTVAAAATDAAAAATAATGSGEAGRAYTVAGGLDCAPQVDAKPSLGTLLLEVLGFYGHIFDPKRHAILGGVGMGAIPPAGCGFALRRDIPSLIGLSPSPFDPFAMQPLLCIDPVDLSNNAARACYRIAAVQKLFAQTAASAVTAAGASVASENDGVGAGCFLAPIGATPAGFLAPIGATPAGFLAPIGATPAGFLAPIGATPAGFLAPIGAPPAGFLAPIGADGEPVDLRDHAGLALAETIIASSERLGEGNWPKRPASA